MAAPPSTAALPWGDERIFKGQCREPRISRISRIGLLIFQRTTRFQRRSFFLNMSHFIRVHPCSSVVQIFKKLSPRISRNITDWAFNPPAHHTLPAQILLLEYESLYPCSSVLIRGSNLELSPRISRISRIGLLAITAHHQPRSFFLNMNQFIRLSVVIRGSKSFHHGFHEYHGLGF